MMDIDNSNLVEVFVTCPHTLRTCPHTLGTCPHTLGTCPHTLGTCPHTLGTCPHTLGTYKMGLANSWELPVLAGEGPESSGNGCHFDS
jgi:hypothetical protein